MLDSTTINSNCKPENLHIARYEGVIVDAICSQAFLFGGNGMGKRFIRNSIPLCACRCGEEVKRHTQINRWNKYLSGHQNRKRNHSEETKLKISKFQKNRIMSEEQKRKISKALIGKIPWNKGQEMPEEIILKLSGVNNHNYNKKAWNNGKKMSRETCKKLSLIKQNVSEETRRKLSLANSGSNHPQWKGGISCEPYCDIWTDKEYKQSIKDRDNNECQNLECRKNCNHLSLTIHHINYKKKECDPKNLITLCHSCNSRANSNRESWERLYKNILFNKYGLRKGGMTI